MLRLLEHHWTCICPTCATGRLTKPIDVGELIDGPATRTDMCYVR